MGHAIDDAVTQLARLPGIGRKTATRLVYWILRAPKGTAGAMAAALQRLEADVQECSVCCDLSPENPCRLCRRGDRDESIILVVEHPQDIQAFERTAEFKGRYHVLHGALSPLDGITPDQLRIRNLLARLHQTSVVEIILATDPDVEGDATALYLARLLEPVGVKVTRLAHGISVGTEIEYADTVSLARALEHRREMGG
jgi:recombination protein RecR